MPLRFRQCEKWLVHCGNEVVLMSIHCLQAEYLKQIQVKKIWICLKQNNIYLGILNVLRSNRWIVCNEVFVLFISEPYIETWFWILCIVFQCFCIPGMLALNVADQFQQYYLIRFMQIWVWVKSYSVQSRMLPFVWASYSCSITDLAFLPVKYNTFFFFTFEILVCDDCWQLFCPSIL